MKYDEIGEWSEIKLEIIKEYAGAYTKILSKKDWCKGYAYIDAFAGPGRCIRKTTGEFILGSPLNALLVSPPFTEYHYIDLDSKRVEELEKMATDNSKIKVYEGDCNEQLLKNIFPDLVYSSFKRALCFLDPYGLHLEWRTIETAGRMRTIDIFINFPVMDINRNVLFEDLSRAKKEDLQRMASLWGDESWQSLLYRDIDDLFGQMHRVKVEDYRRLASGFRERLIKVGGYGYVPEPILMRNTNNGPLYYLFFASPQQVAGKIMEGIFDKYRGIL